MIRVLIVDGSWNPIRNASGIAGGLLCWAAGLWLALLMLAMVLPGVAAQPAVEIPRTIRVVVDNAYAPYSFLSDDGKLQGILIDQWRLWGKKNGIKVEIHAMDWGGAVRRMRVGEFDVITASSRRPSAGTTLISLLPIPRSKPRSSFGTTFPASPTSHH